jgi:hypothetical protein
MSERLHPVIQSRGVFLPENMIVSAMFAKQRTPRRSATQEVFCFWFEMYQVSGVRVG